MDARAPHDGQGEARGRGRAWSPSPSFCLPGQHVLPAPVVKRLGLGLRRRTWCEDAHTRAGDAFEREAHRGPAPGIARLTQVREGLEGRAEGADRRAGTPAVVRLGRGAAVGHGLRPP